MNATAFAEKWIASWNSHQLEDILSHYSDDIEITTPMIKLAGGIDSGTLKGKEAVAGYWAKALEKVPDLHFELIAITEGINSVALYYRSVMDKYCIEVMTFNPEGLVCKMSAHYTGL